MRVLQWSILFCYLCFLTSGCAAQRAFSAGESYEEEGQYEEAMFSYAEAYKYEPEVCEYRVRFLDTRNKAANERYRKGVKLFEGGEYYSAMLEFQTAYGLNPSQDIYKQMADKAAKKKDAQQAFQEGLDFEKDNKLKEAYRLYTKATELNPDQNEYSAAQKRVLKSLSEKPAETELRLRSSKPFAFKLREARLKSALRILSQLSGITFILDEQVKDKPVSISFEKTTFQQVLDIILSMNKLGCKILNETTVLVYQRTPEKVKQYEDMKISTFHLNYMEAKSAANLIRTMLPVRKIHVNEESNSIVVRDTCKTIDVIEKLLDANDYPDAEVLLDIEVVELTDKNTKNVGLVLSRYAVDLGAFNMGSGLVMTDKLSSATQNDGSTTTEAGIANLLQVFNWNGYGGFVTVPSATYNFSKTIAKGEVLSNPKIRVKNKEKAKFNIGTRVPITTTTTNGTATGYSVNVQYVDVGVKVDAEPIIQRDNDINIKLSLEVSSIIGKEKLADGTTTVVTIGTRNLQTVLGLKDGETSVIGGLIARTNTDSKTKVFLLGDLPLIGPLLSGNDTTNDKTELLLAITPHLVRGVTVAPKNMAEFMSGKEDDPSLEMFQTSFEEDSDSDGNPPQSATNTGLQIPAVQARVVTSAKAPPARSENKPIAPAPNGMQPVPITMQNGSSQPVSPVDPQPQQAGNAAISTPESSKTASPQTVLSNAGNPQAATPQPTVNQATNTPQNLAGQPVKSTVPPVFGAPRSGTGKAPATGAQPVAGEVPKVKSAGIQAVTTNKLSPSQPNVPVTVIPGNPDSGRNPSEKENEKATPLSSLTTP